LHRPVDIIVDQPPDEVLPAFPDRSVDLPDILVMQIA
jgi:hypothetical protein